MISLVITDRIGVSLDLEVDLFLGSFGLLVLIPELNGEYWQLTTDYAD